MCNALACIYCYFLRAEQTGWKNQAKLLTAADRCKNVLQPTIPQKLESSFCKALNTVEARFSRKIGHRTFVR